MNYSVALICIAMSFLLHLLNPQSVSVCKTLTSRKYSTQPHSENKFKKMSIEAKMVKSVSNEKLKQSLISCSTPSRGVY